VSLRPRLFCEFPAGLASVSLRLQGGAHCRPPISRLGNKAGYAKVILGTLGLHSGQGAGGYWWAEADADVAALLRIYPDPAALLEVARIIRGWKDEEPRALWERLRAERKERGAQACAEGTARWMWVQGHGSPDGRLAAQYLNPGGNADKSWAAPPREWLADRAQRLAEYAMIASSNRLICVSGPDLMNTGDGGTRFGGEFATPPVKVAEGMEATAQKGWPTVRVSRSIPTAAEVSAALGTPGDLEGCVVYSDPPYINTTPYAHNLTREAVVAMARDFAAMGATVAISEQTPISELDGWEAVEITGGRVGQKRVFSEQQTEFITMNRTPGFKIAKQYSLFGVSQ